MCTDYSPKKLANVLASCFALCTVMLGDLARADSLSLIRDINRTFASFEPGNHCEIQGRTLFVGEEPIHGAELWLRESPSAAPQLLADIAPGPASGLSRNGSLLDCTAIGNVLFFPATGPDFSAVLWRSDGTPQGTFRVTADSSSNPSVVRDLTIVGTTLFFIAGVDGDSNRSALWKSNGTPSGTILVKELDRFQNSAPTELVALSDRLFFRGYSAAAGIELWSSDGTAVGTRIFRDLHPGSPSAEPFNLTTFNGKLVFSISSGPNGPGLWASDGTSAGTVELSRLDLGSPSYPRRAQLFSVGESLVFAAREAATGSELWRTDGTVDGTVQLSDILPGPTSGQPFILAANVRHVPTLYFAARNVSNHFDLWRSDGTSSGTTFVASLPPTLQALYCAEYLSDLFFFCVRTGAPSRGDLYRTNGTNQGTINLTAELVQQYQVVDEVHAIADQVVFTAGDSAASTRYISDGTILGTRPYYSPDSEFVSATEGSSPGKTIPLQNSRVLFSATDGIHGSELWTSDGSSEGTAMLSDLTPGALSSAFSGGVTLNGAALFGFASNGQGEEPWISDGTLGGTAKLKEIGAGSDSSKPSRGFQFTVSGNLAIFSACDDQHGCELWRTDGTVQGTQLIKDIEPGVAGSTPTGLIAGNGNVYFIASSTQYGLELWRTDGTAAGTTLVVDLQPGASSGFTHLEPDAIGLYGNRMIFGSDELIEINLDSSAVRFLTNFSAQNRRVTGGVTISGDKVYFTLQGNGTQIWSYDLMSATTTRLSETSGEILGSINGFTILGVYAGNGLPSRLLRTDGSILGTVPLASIPGTTESRPGYFQRRAFVAGNRIYAVISDPLHGFELWQSDATELGTALLDEMMPGQAGSLLGGIDLVGSGDKVFLSALHPEVGRELFQLRRGSEVEFDQCPNDPLKISAGVCGCQVQDHDRDQDGAPDCTDSCRADPGKTIPGICGCGAPESDVDADGALDCVDSCPLDSLKSQPGRCGCGVLEFARFGTRNNVCVNSSLANLTPPPPKLRGMRRRISVRLTALANARYYVTVRRTLRANKSTHRRRVRISQMVRETPNFLLARAASGTRIVVTYHYRAAGSGSVDNSLESRPAVWLVR